MRGLFVCPELFSTGSDMDFGQLFTQSRTVGVCRQIVIECFSCEFAAGWTDSRKILQLCGCCLIAFPRWIVTQRADNVLLQSCYENLLLLCIKVFGIFLMSRHKIESRGGHNIKQTLYKALLMPRIRCLLALFVIAKIKHDESAGAIFQHHIYPNHIFTVLTLSYHMPHQDGRIQ